MGPCRPRGQRRAHVVRQPQTEMLARPPGQDRAGPQSRAAGGAGAGPGAGGAAAVSGQMGGLANWKILAVGVTRHNTNRLLVVASPAVRLADDRRTVK